MYKFLILLKKEFLQIFRDKFIWRSVLLLPVVQLLVLPLAADNEIRDFRMAAIDRDNTQFSRLMLADLQAGGYFTLSASAAAWAEAVRMIERGEVDMIVEIPTDFERNIVLGRGAEVAVHISAINGLSAGVAAGYVNTIVGDFERRLAAERLIPERSEGRDEAGAAQIGVSVQEWYNSKFDYKTVIVPGILALLVTVVGMSMMALNAVKEKERGTIEQLNVTPMSRTQYALAKTVPFFIIGLVQFTIGLVLARLVYGISVAGNFGVLYGIIALYLVGLLFLGFVVSNVSQTQVQSIFLSFFLMTVLILMSGLFTPVESMPEWAQRADQLNPVAHIISAIKMVLVKGSPAAALKSHWVMLGIFAGVMGVATVTTFRKFSR